MMEPCFTNFLRKLKPSDIPAELNNPFESFTPEICKIAATELQNYLDHNAPSWIHNFGTDPKKAGIAKGKMFGILVVTNSKNELGYLSTFSGKIADKKYPTRFVPSVFDVSTDDFFINKGMLELSQISNDIKKMETSSSEASASKVEALKNIRKTKSAQLQQQLFDNYHFINQKKESTSLDEIFKKFNKKPPSAAGECAAPKLLQYAFQHDMKPLAIAEFWWGQSPKSEIRVHGEFYTSCNDKCRPILNYMLGQKF